MCLVLTNLLRVLPPSLSAEYAKQHDDAIWDCFCKLMGAKSFKRDALARKVATLPCRNGGLGLRSAVRTSPAAFWASWVDGASVLAAKVPRAHAIFLREVAADAPVA